jgi:hypothetical protein
MHSIQLSNFEFIIHFRILVATTIAFGPELLDSVTASSASSIDSFV